MKMKQSYMVMVAVAFIGLNGCGGGGGGSSQGNGAGNTQSVPFSAPELSDAEKASYLDAINVARGNVQHCGDYGDYEATTPLSWNDALYRAAYEHSSDLANTNTFSHTGSGTEHDWTAEVLSLGRGSTYQERIENNGYTQWRAIVENITAGTNTDTAQKAVNAWLQSPGHCANLMNPHYTEIGMAHVYKGDSTLSHYWTQVFGSR